MYNYDIVSNDNHNGDSRKCFIILVFYAKLIVYVRVMAPCVFWENIVYCLQVSRRGLAHQQFSLVNPQDTVVKQSLVIRHSVKNSKQDVGQQGQQDAYSVQKTTDEHGNVSCTLRSGLSATQDSMGTLSLPQATDKAESTSKKMPSTTKRLLAPSFFSKKS